MGLILTSFFFLGSCEDNGADDEDNDTIDVTKDNAKGRTVVNISYSGWNQIIKSKADGLIL